MNSEVHGIHHVTAIAGDPQKNLDFYVGVLGLRLVKKTVNFDDPGTYHFYYGNATGEPGSILTFFPWGAEAPMGKPGTGQLVLIGFSVPETALDFWHRRLQRFDVRMESSRTWREMRRLRFLDPDGIMLELVAEAADARPGWGNSVIPAEAAIRGFHHVGLAEADGAPTSALLQMLGFHWVDQRDDRTRRACGNESAGTIVDILPRPDGALGRMGVGAVHHVAWRTTDDASQLEVRRLLLQHGYQATAVMDRKYFHSIYFREPGGVLFEVATDPPGFAVDEAVEALGTTLKLPEWLETRRSQIEGVLPKLRPPEVME